MRSPPRPLLWLALALFAGTLAGRELRPPMQLLVLAPLAAAALALLRRRGAALRAPPEASWAVLVLALAAARGTALGAHDPRPGPAAAAEVRRARDVPCVGIVEPRGAGRAVLLPLDPSGTAEPRGPQGTAEPGAPRAVPEAGAAWRRRGPGHELLHAFQGPRPPAGALVLVLPGSQVRPWARGPTPRARKLDGLSLVAPDELVVLAPPARDPLRAWLVARIEELRAAARRRFLAEGSPAGIDAGEAEAGVARRWWVALVLGDPGLLGAEEEDLFSRTGTRHMLAVSGLHVGIAAALLLGLRRLAGARAAGPAGGLLVGAGLLAYALLAGAAAPVLRAVVAGTLALVRPPGGPAEVGLARRADPLSLWGLALALEGLLAPAGLGDLGLQLSYAATLALLLVTGPLGRRLDALLPRARPPLVETPWTALSGGLRRRLRRAITSGSAASLAAFLATLPLLGAAFGELAPMGIVATPALLPALFVAVGTGLLWLVQPLGALEAFASAGLGAMEAALRLADLAPATPLPWAPRPFLGTALLCAGALALAAGVLPRAGARALSAAAAAWLVPWAAAPAGLEVHALDVGHGTAVVVRGPGLPALVFDAGSRDRPGVFEEALGPLLCSWEVTEVVIVLSHAHRDHGAALARVARRHAVRSWAGARPLPAGPGGVRPALAPGGPAGVDVAQGRVRVPLPGSPVEATLLRGAAVEGNEGSRALELVLGGERVLLTGDAEGEGLRRALAEGWIRGPCRLLLFPHHGSDGLHVARLIESARPAEVWISASGRTAVEGEIARRGLRLRSTAAEGPLALLLPSHLRHGFDGGVSTPAGSAGGEPRRGLPREAVDGGNRATTSREAG